MARSLRRRWRSKAGQWAIGVALGLYFSPDVVREIVRLSPWIALAVVFSILLGWLGAWLLAKTVRADAPTAFFAMAIGGAPEMAAQAHRNGGQVDKVAASHALRIMLVVLIVPFAFNAMNVHGLDPYAPLAQNLFVDRLYRVGRNHRGSCSGNGAVQVA